MIVKGLMGQHSIDVSAIVSTLESYAELIEPWARSVAGVMIADVARRNEKAWQEVGAEIGRELRNEIRYAPTGATMQSLLNDSVGLIKSLPLEAAKRVHELALKGLVDSRRAGEIAKEILATGNVTEARARLIARTEVARTASVLTQARSQYVGSQEYIWRTAGDSDVRDSHAEMEGKVVRWDTVPKLSDGTSTHAGQIYNCRCYAEPIIPDFF